MLRIIATHGLSAGLILGLFAAITWMTGPPPEPWGMIFGYVGMLLALSMIFVGIRRHREVAGGGVIGFWPAFGLGLAISLVAAILYVVAWEISLAFSDTDFIAEYGRQMIAGMEAKGASPQEIAKASADLAQFAASYADPMFRLPMTFLEIAPVGLLVSLVSAGLLRNPRFMPARREA